MKKPQRAGRALLPWAVLYLAFAPACSTSLEELRDSAEPTVGESGCGEPSETQSPQPPPALVRTEVLSEGRVRLRFPAVAAEPSPRRFTREDVRCVLEPFHEELEALKQRRG